jgi:hypothetical protein
LITKDLVKLFLDESELTVVNGSGSECDFLCLFNKGFEDFGMAVALVDCGVCREEVKVTLTWVKEKVP